MENECTNVQALEVLPPGAPVGASPGSDPDEGTTDDPGIVAPVPSEYGAGAGANGVSLVTDEGGAIRGGNC